MRVVFNANIEENGLGGWMIRLVNTHSKEEIFCNSFDEFTSQMQFIGTCYGENVDIKWSKANNLTPEHFFEIRNHMNKLNKELNND